MRFRSAITNLVGYEPCPGWVRVSVGTHEEIEFFLDKLASLEVGAPESGEGRPN